MARNIKNLRILKILLSCPKGSLTKYRIAKIAGCSTPWVIEFLKNLESQRLIKKTGVLNFTKLVEYYLAIAPKLKYFDFFVQDPIKFLKTAKLDYAMTTYGAENYISHHLFPSRYDVYIKGGDLKKWRNLILKNGLIGKGNLRLIMANDELMLKDFKTIKGIRLVSLPQLLVDLKKEGGVCIEAYNILVKQNV